MRVLPRDDDKAVAFSREVHGVNIESCEGEHGDLRKPVHSEEPQLGD